MNWTIERARRCSIKRTVLCNSGAIVELTELLQFIPVLPPYGKHPARAVHPVNAGGR